MFFLCVLNGFTFPSWEENIDAKLKKINGFAKNFLVGYLLVVCGLLFYVGWEKQHRTALLQDMKTAKIEEIAKDTVLWLDEVLVVCFFSGVANQILSLSGDNKKDEIKILCTQVVVCASAVWLYHQTVVPNYADIWKWVFDSL